MNKIMNNKYGIVLSVFMSDECSARYHKSNLYSFEILPTVHEWIGDYRLFNQELCDLLLSPCEILDLRLLLHCDDISYCLSVVKMI